MLPVIMVLPPSVAPPLLNEPLAFALDSCYHEGNTPSAKEIRRCGDKERKREGLAHNPSSVNWHGVSRFRIMGHRHAGPVIMM
jgi:hypothetical protein